MYTNVEIWTSRVRSKISTVLSDALLICSDPLRRDKSRPWCGWKCLASVPKQGPRKRERLEMHMFLWRAQKPMTLGVYLGRSWTVAWCDLHSRSALHYATSQSVFPKHSVQPNEGCTALPELCSAGILNISSKSFGKYCSNYFGSLHFSVHLID